MNLLKIFQIIIFLPIAFFNLEEDNELEVDEFFYSPVQKFIETENNSNFNYLFKDNDNNLILDINSLNLYGEINYFPEGMVNLQKLNVSNNKILKINNLHKLPKLSVLQANNNKLQSISLFNTNLNKLVINTNEITEIKYPNYLKSVSNLNLSNNKLTFFDFSRLEKIENLNLANNLIQSPINYLRPNLPIV
jgi:hypothetical protein